MIILDENHTPVTSPLDNTNIEEYTKNAFDKLLNKEEHDLDFQTKNKGGSKLRSWVYNWGERKNHPSNPNKFIFECNQKLDNGENCTSKIETSGPTGNIISHLNRKHKIYEHSKPSATITPSLKQVKIDRYTISSDSHPQMTPDRQKYLETLLFEWLILDFQPLYLLKSPSFPYEFSKNKLKQYIHENAASVSLTCDLWTSRSKQGFLGVTCHFITPDFEMREITLAIQYMPYPHTGEAIQHALEKIITQWELQNKVFFCTTDNTSNMKKCLNQIVWLHRLSCTAHTIQLVVGKGLLTAEILIARAKRLINFFTSPKQNKRLLNAQKKISDDVEEGTWERLIALKPYIDIVISSLNACKDNNAKEDVKRLNKVNLTNDEWEIIRDLLEILGPFAELTERLEGTKYATMSYIYPGIIKLKTMFSLTINSNLDLETNDDAFENHQFEEVDEDDEPDARRKIKINTPTNTFGLLDDIKSNLYKALENYFEVIEKEALIAALLDPRKKKQHLQTMNKRSLFSDDESHDLQTEDNEVERYLVMAQIKNDQDPLKWWDVNKSQFPVLAQLARKYLSIQATLGASERVFSDAGLIMSSKRTSIKADLFEALIFLKRNGNLVGVGEMFNNNNNNNM
ncbi:zinc finger BED domain-containing protein 1-like [Rhizophagus irregularis DAOM 181602=DAOM 197198]|nr:zinc finger BED domain-containing protein 1-like [Rhizophagus irregularis DAOM 181602=DAOM 197198]